jgi:uncharacterized delta-60 repeat protein
MSGCAGKVIGMIACVTVSGAVSADGVVLLDGGDGWWDDPRKALIASDGRIYISEHCGVFALQNTGSLVMNPATGARLNPVGCHEDVALRSDNALIAARWDPGYEVHVNAYDPAGNVVLNFRKFAHRHWRTLSVQPDGKLLAGGDKSFVRMAPPFIDDWVILRFQADGADDISFGQVTAGETLYDAGSDDDEYVTKLSPLPGGKVLASGLTLVGPGQNDYDTVLLRLDNGGLPDVAFGTGGQMRFAGRANAVDVDASGRIYVNAGGNIILRLNSDGSSDASYSSAVRPADTTITDVKIDSLGRAVVFGSTTRNGPRAGYIARLKSDGSFDTTFGGSGEVVFNIGAGGVSNLPVFGAIDTGNKPLAALSVIPQSDPGTLVYSDAGVVRFNENGTPDLTFGATHVDPDLYPDAMALQTKHVGAGAVGVVSDPAVITGINGTLRIEVLPGSTASASFAVGCKAPWITSTWANAVEGDTICVRHNAANQAPNAAETRLTVGGRLLTFTSISNTDALDFTPDQFTFTDLTGVALGASSTSNVVSISGLTGSANVTVQNGEYSKNCNPNAFTTAPGTIINGDSVCVRHKSATVLERTVTTTLMVGGVSGAFSSTTVGSDAVPDAFNFQAQAGAATGVEAISNPVTITGINTAAAISIANGQYSKGCNSDWTSASGTVTNGQLVCVKHVTSSQPASSVTTTLTVGGISGAFTSTTAAAANAGDLPRSGGGGGAFNLPGLFALLGLMTWVTRRRLRPS